MRKLITGLLCMSMILVSTGCAVRSSSENENDPGIRIISTSAALCVILEKLDLDLVGVPETAFQLPERYKDVTKVGLPMTPDLEIVKALNPTDVLTPNSLQYDLKPQYESIGVPSTFVNLMSLEGMFKSIEGLGKKYNRVPQAAALIEEYNRFMEDYHKKIEGKEKPRVLILMGLPGTYMVATEKSYVGSLVRLAGGVNVFDSEEALLSVNTEALLQKDPDIILRTAHAMPEIVMESFEKEFKENDIWKHFRAVQEGKVYNLSHEMFGMSANLNYTEGLNYLQEILYEQE
ncbi:heme ABC transporter substrate-binding protein IsdE [Geosporobacter ferrireducens]|uniref:High-affinity heme uptake system protein IsdE n=1 Tax=Geosporobacter ferrireducens TaxID=1424294 RepID=A0A1D8GG09_9FIRM|nr:heme ABC transporter substrate-binding protein IsdE [Geosporobacter ferrireducens]AOT69847.1 heme ABC transporter substrate-binding protein IsdE [Geosporobacter ferrireducens]